MTGPEKYMQRCLELATLGAGKVTPNPMVGAVLVYNDKIIGEGYHQKYGGAHAEVNCIASVSEKEFIEKSTLYVSLEPCSHFGKTPPCTDLIIKNKIPKVIIGCRDPFKEVNGKGIEKLKSAGAEVLVGVLEDECKELNKRFFTFHTKQRPYIILKWAETGNGKIARPPNPVGGALAPENLEMISSFIESKNPAEEGREARLLISDEYSNRLVHKWRSEETAILVGTNTAILDDPELTTRLWTGKSPIRLVIDMHLRLPSSLKIFNNQAGTIIFNSIKQEEKENLFYFKIGKEKNIIPQLLNACYQLNIQSIIVEGGAKLLQSFIDEEIWDEARIIKNEELIINNGLNAPVLKKGQKYFEKKLFSDRIDMYKPSN